jgi:hypothetical protein
MENQLLLSIQKSTDAIIFLDRTDGVNSIIMHRDMENESMTDARSNRCDKMGNGGTL